MSIKFAGRLNLLGALLGPMGAYAVDTTTDTAGQYVDDATITAKVNTAFAEDKRVISRDIGGGIGQGVVDLTGEGLPGEKLAQLFQPFDRLDHENTAEERTGIGVAVSKRLAELMGGTIGVQSAVGVGGEFWVDFAQGDRPEESLL